MTPLIHTCRWCQDRGCLACDALRDARMKQEQSIQAGAWFLQRERQARRLPEEYDDALKNPDILYLVGEAIAEGRRQMQAMGEHSTGEHHPDCHDARGARFGLIDFTEGG